MEMNDEKFENEVLEHERIFMTKPMGYPFELIYKVFDKINNNGNDNFGFALEAIYLLGYMNGIRSERERRRKTSV